MENVNEPAQTEPGAQGGAKGKPDPAIAASKYKQERDEAREKVADLTAQLETLRESVKGLKTAEDVQQAVDEALSKSNSEFEATRQKWEQRERELAVSTELAQAGCMFWSSGILTGNQTRRCRTRLQCSASLSTSLKSR